MVRQMWETAVTTYQAETGLQMVVQRKCTWQAMDRLDKGVYRAGKDTKRH